MMGFFKDEIKKEKKEYFPAKTENCRRCAEFDGVKMCKRYRMISAPDKWCKSFREAKK